MMGWLDYYQLLEKYDGDLSKATRAELHFAALRNPNDPISAKRLAEEKYRTQKWLKGADEG